LIIISGANGQLGRGIVESLLEKMPADQIGVSVRDPKKAQDLDERGVRVRKGDFDEPESLSHAFEGASQVLIVSSNSAGKGAVQQHKNAIDAAKSAGAGRILYTSHVGASPTSPFVPMVDHAATEKLLASSGVPFTSLHNGFYAESALWQLGEALNTGKLAAPEDGPVSWTAHADLADLAATVLCGETIDGTSPALTASEAIDLEGIAAIASELTGKEIRRVVVPDDEYKAGMISRGMPEHVVNMPLGMFLASRAGDFSKTDPTFERLIGRKPMSLRRILEYEISKSK
jgi:NAD(P)H dehydrogenase (quinone)